MAGFRYAGRLSGGAPTIVTAKYKDSETLSFGDIGNIESGQVDLGATADTKLVLIVSATLAGTTASSDCEVIIDPDIILEVVDNNARLLGATLDLTGATGAQGVTTSSNKEFIVLSASSATEPTRVGFNTGRALLNVAS